MLTLDLGACARVTGPCTSSMPCSSLPVPFTAHTGYQTGKHSGNCSHSLSRQQGEEQHDLTLPAQNETGKQLLGPGGRGKLGWDRRQDDEAPMWGTGRIPAGLHVHITRLCWAAREEPWSAGCWLNSLTSSHTFHRESGEPSTMLAFYTK